MTFRLLRVSLCYTVLFCAAWRILVRASVSSASLVFGICLDLGAHSQSWPENVPVSLDCRRQRRNIIILCRLCSRFLQQGSILRRCRCWSDPLSMPWVIRAHFGNIVDGPSFPLGSSARYPENLERYRVFQRILAFGAFLSRNVQKHGENR